MKPSAPPVVAAMANTTAAKPAGTARVPPIIPGGAARAAPVIPGATARAPPAIPGAGRAAPPPPPPPPAAPHKEMYKALYNFAGQEGEIQLVKGEEVEVKEKDDNGECSLCAR
jgi:myosin-1